MNRYKLLNDIVLEKNGQVDIIPKNSIIVESPTVAEPEIEEPKVAPKTNPDLPQTDKPTPQKFDPFHPPQPKIEPNPKASAPSLRFRTLVRPLASRQLKEAYEDEVVPSTQAFWSNIRKNNHKFAKHPILAMHGDKLSKEGYGTHEGINADGRYLTQIMMEIMRRELQHKEELQELAKEICAKIWGIPKDTLTAILTMNNDVNAGGGGDEDDEDTEFPEELRKEINKRITLNTLTQGAAVHQMMTMHFLVDKEIKAIDPELLRLYTAIAKGSHKIYWLTDFEEIMAMLKVAAVGSSKIEWQDGQPKVVAKGLVFPVMVQELSKGICDLLHLHGYSKLPEKTQLALKKHADVLEDEPYLIQVGPALWKRFIKVLPKDIDLSTIMAKLSMEEPDKVHEIIDAVIDNPEKATELINMIIKGNADKIDL